MTSDPTISQNVHLNPANYITTSAKIYVCKLVSLNQTINTRICIAQNKQSMSSNGLPVTALEQTSFQFFADKTHSSSTQFCRQSVPRRRAAHSERATTKNSSCPLTVQGATDRGTHTLHSNIFCFLS